MKAARLRPILDKIERGWEDNAWLGGLGTTEHHAYKMVTIVTVDGRVLNGIVAEEDRTRVVLKTVEQPRVVVAKEDIDVRKVSPKSMMPDGQLEKMKPRQIFDLIKYLGTTGQVEIAQ